MKDTRVDRLVDGLKALVDSLEPGIHNHGPMRVRFEKPSKWSESGSSAIHIEAGWDSNYGGSVVIECSPTGKVIRVYVTDDEKNKPRIYRNNKEIK